MATEITEFGYQQIRNFIEGSWIYIALIDSGDDEVLRLSVSDPRVTWIHDPNDAILRLRVQIQGSDIDVPIPTTFAKSILYNSAVSSDIIHERVFDNATIANPNDQLTVTHSIEVPEQP